MPIPRRNFDLGILPEVEAWMVSIIRFLSARRGEAFTKEELRSQARPARIDKTSPVRMDDVDAMETAISELIARGALEQRFVKRRDSREPDFYYAFARDINIETWDPSGLGS